MSTKDQDRLEQELDALEARYRAQSGEEPPELLDQAVLNRARRAAERHATRPWNFGWMHATATAALIVLGLAVVMQIRQAAVPLEVPARFSEEQARDLQAEAEPLERPVDAAEALRQQEAERLEDHQQAQKSEVLRELREEVLRPAAPAPAAEPPVVIVRPVPAGWERDTLADGSAATAARADDAAGAEAVGQARQRVVSPGSTGADPDAWNFSGNTVVLSSAEEWLAYILELKQAGEERAWRSELEAFRAAFPDHPVPEEVLVAAAKPIDDPETDG